MKGRAIIVHNIDHARNALAAAKSLKVTVNLLSPPGAAGYMGAAVFGDIIKRAALEYPGVDFTATLDCSNSPGLALGALRHGIKGLKIRLEESIRTRIRDIADQYCATIDDSHGETLDLLCQTDPARACRSWLGKEPT